MDSVDQRKHITIMHISTLLTVAAFLASLAAPGVLAAPVPGGGSGGKKGGNGPHIAEGLYEKVTGAIAENDGLRQARAGERFGAQVRGQIAATRQQQNRDHAEAWRQATAARRERTAQASAPVNIAAPGQNPTVQNPALRAAAAGFQNAHARVQENVQHSQQLPFHPSR